MLAPLAVFLRETSGGGGDSVVLDSSSSTSISDSLVVMDSNSLSSGSSSSMVVPGNSSNGSMRGPVGLETLDEGGTSRNFFRHQELRSGEYITVSGVVPSGTRPPFAERRTLV